jgi:hypothetical protein
VNSSQGLAASYRYDRLKDDMEQFHAQMVVCFPPRRIPESRIYGGSAERAAVDPEVQELCNLTGGKTWSEIEVEHLSKLSEYLTLMSNEAFTAFLPAFLEICIEELDAAEEGTTSIVVSAICPLTGEGYMDEFTLERLKLFDERQARVIAGWLQCSAKFSISDALADDIKRTLESYWFRWGDTDQSGH